MAVDNEARRKGIRRRLREIRRNPAAPGAGSEAQRLTAEYKRLVSAHRAPAPARLISPAGLSEQDAAAVATWPAELRARVQDGALSRTILPWGRD